MIGLLTQRGDAALAVGDIIAARLLYERAAAMGSATAATAAGKTYDLNFLLRADTHGIRPDPATAATWYRRAAALGDPQARILLGRLEAQSRP
jgi:TPR repeat protein